MRPLAFIAWLALGVGALVLVFIEGCSHKPEVQRDIAAECESIAAAIDQEQGRKAVCEGGVIHAHHLPPSLQTAEMSGTLPRASLEAAVGALEKDLLQDALKLNPKFDVHGAADAQRLLGQQQLAARR